MKNSRVLYRKQFENDMIKLDSSKLFVRRSQNHDSFLYRIYIHLQAVFITQNLKLILLFAGLILILKQHLFHNTPRNDMEKNLFFKSKKIAKTLCDRKN